MASAWRSLFNLVAVVLEARVAAALRFFDAGTGTPFEKRPCWRPSACFGETSSLSAISDSHGELFVT